MPKQRKALSLSSFHKAAAPKHQEDVDQIHVTVKGRPIPFGIFVIVYSFLSHHDVKQASLVNRFFHAISEHQGTWQELFKRKANVIFAEGTWKKFFNADKEDKQANWKTKFVELDKNLNKDESFYVIKSAHQGCKDSHTQDDRKSRMLPLTGLNNLHFGLQGTETIPKCLIFSSSRPTVEGSLATLKVWSLTLLSQLPQPLRNEPFDLLCRGPHGGIEGIHNPSPYVVHHLATREIGANVTKMYPVYTYFKEQENTWEYAAICGDDAGQVSFFTGLFSDGTQTSTGSQIFKTNGKVVGLKCILEEQGFSGFKQAYGCGFNDSGQLYDLQSNQVIATFPHEEGINTDSVDVSLSGTTFVLGQVQRKSNQQHGMVRLCESGPAGPQEVFSQQASLGPVKCVKFVNGSYGEPGDCFVFTSRDGLSLWDKRVGKAQLKYATNAPLDQLAIISSRQLIACTCGPDLMLWDMRGCRPIRKLAHGHQWCSSIACDPFPGSPSTGVIITGGTEGGMRLWQVSHLWQPSRGGEDRRRPHNYGRSGAVEKGEERRSNGDATHARGNNKGNGAEQDGAVRPGRGRGFEGGRGRGKKGGEQTGGLKGGTDGADAHRGGGSKGGGKGQAAPAQWPLAPPPTPLATLEETTAATHVPTGAPNPAAGPQPYRPPLGSAMKMPPTAASPSPAHAFSGYAAGKGQQVPPGAGHPYPNPGPSPAAPGHGYPPAPLPPHMYPSYSPTPAMPYRQSSYMPPPPYYSASAGQPHAMPQPPPPGFSTAYPDMGYLSAGWTGDPDDSTPVYSQRNGVGRQYWTG